jgi:hypothetical protein
MCIALLLVSEHGKTYVLLLLRGRYLPARRRGLWLGMFVWEKTKEYGTADVLLSISGVRMSTSGCFMKEDAVG